MYKNQVQILLNCQAKDTFVTPDQLSQQIGDNEYTCDYKYWCSRTSDKEGGQYLICFSNP